jgi:hypothetical protein
MVNDPPETMETYSLTPKFAIFCNGEEKSVDREKRTGQWETSLESQNIRIPFWFSIHTAVGLIVSVCGANVRPNLLREWRQLLRSRNPKS